MPVVFQRFETTVALPIEYGAVNAASVVSGLLFYNEAKYMTYSQVALQLLGCLLILLGIAIGRLPASSDCGTRLIANTCRCVFHMH